MRIEIKNNICVVMPEYHFTRDSIEEIMEYLDDLPVDGVLINFKAVPALNSLIIGLLTTLYKHLHAEEIPIGLSNLNDESLKTLEVCGLKTLLPQYQSEADGIYAMKKG